MKPGSSSHRAFAVLRLGECAEPGHVRAVRNRLREIAGVSDVRIDAWRHTVHVLYDGGSGALEEVVRTVRGVGWKPTLAPCTEAVEGKEARVRAANSVPGRTNKGDES